jgi:hypothetical protein
MLSSLFKVRETPTEGIITLLEQTTLGTNGAQYRHLDTRKRILEADNPLFLSVERNERVLGNLTFCRRGTTWYIRYFAFASTVQSGKSGKKVIGGNSIYKKEIAVFFNEVLTTQTFGKVNRMYAYIEPRNERSMWMGEQFGFEKVATLATQSFSRYSPKSSSRIQKLENWEDVAPVVRSTYSSHNFYHENHIQKGPFYTLRNHSGEILALAATTHVTWEIVRLPGKYGKVLTKIIPFIPLLNRIIRPENHSFLVMDAVCLPSQNPNDLEELFAGILHAENKNLILWWIDEKDSLYNEVKTKLKWGLLHTLVGVNPVDVMERHSKHASHEDRPVFVSAFDLV